MLPAAPMVPERWVVATTAVVVPVATTTVVPVAAVVPITTTTAVVVPQRGVSATATAVVVVVLLLLRCLLLGHYYHRRYGRAVLGRDGGDSVRDGDLNRRWFDDVRGLFLEAVLLAVTAAKEAHGRVGLVVGIGSETVEMGKWVWKRVILVFMKVRVGSTCDAETER